MSSLRALARPALLVVPFLLVASCSSRDVTASGVALIDPSGLIDDILGSGHPLRLYVVPSADYVCAEGSGGIMPARADVAAFPDDDAEPGALAGAVVDLSIDAEMTVTVVVPVGDWTIYVRGKGTDLVTGVMNTFIGQGCSTTTVANGADLSVAVQLIPIQGEGDCSDTVLSPDEQCFPAGTATCDAMCRTIQQPVNQFVTTGSQLRARASTAAGRRIAITFDDDRVDVAVRLLERNGTPIPGGVAASRDATLDGIMTLPGAQQGGVPAMANDGHFVIALVDYGPTEPDVWAVFFSVDRNFTSRVPLVPVLPLPTQNGIQGAVTRPLAPPSPAFAGNGALLIAFEDSASATGLSARTFAAGSETPTGTAAQAIGTGATGGALPIVAGLPTGFIVVFEADTDIRFQRLDATGAPVDATARTVDDAAAARTTPVVAARADGSFLVAWVEQIGQPTIRARAFGADAMALGPSFTVATTTGAQTAPSVAAGVENYLVAWQAGTGVRARVFSSAGLPMLNRERPPITADFEVAAAGGSPSVVANGDATALTWMVVFDAGGDVFSRLYPR